MNLAIQSVCGLSLWLIAAHHRLSRWLIAEANKLWPRATQTAKSAPSRSLLGALYCSASARGVSAGVESWSWPHPPARPVLVASLPTRQRAVDGRRHPSPPATARSGNTVAEAAPAIASTAAAAAAGDQAAYPAVVLGLLWPIVAPTISRSFDTAYMTVPK